MSLAKGQSLGPYEILAPLGAGGMGEVYRARDTKLNRDVAIKVLPAEFAGHPERLARFRREAQVLASLNHPNIAAIYGLEEDRALIMELVEGENPHGPMPVDRAVALARQLVEALDYAHEKGIVHRDLKPANIKVTPEGRLKVLDFGLAKAMAAETSIESAETIDATRQGVILGTAGYMSPEQTRGESVDKRADIWAFGVVLYELLTGQRPFGGASRSDAMVAVLSKDPDWSALPPGSPVTLLRQCLQKDPKLRLRDIGDARWTAETPPASAPATSRRNVVWSAVAAVVAALLVAGFMWMVLRPKPGPVTRVTIAFPTAFQPRSGTSRFVAVSPDGSRLVYVGGRGDKTALYLRARDQFEAAPIPGTEGAGNPFFSPDGQWIGFIFKNTVMKKVAVTGGPAVTLCDVSQSSGAVWGPNQTIYFSSSSATIRQVSEAGGKPQPVTTRGEGEGSHRYPELLPDGKTLLFSIWYQNDYERSEIAVQSLKTGERKILFKGGSSPHYAPTGHIVYIGPAGLMAVPFDARKLQVTGAPALVLEDVMTSGRFGEAQFAWSADGSLFYIPASVETLDNTLQVLDRKGVARPLLSTPGDYSAPRFSPDGKKVAITIGAGHTPVIWVHDIERGTTTRLTPEGDSFAAAWSRDGKRIAYTAIRSGIRNLFWKPFDHRGPEELLTSDTAPSSLAGTLGYPEAFSPDGRWLAFNTGFGTGPGRQRIWLVPMEGERKPKRLEQTAAGDWQTTFSPDGHWFAYQSSESQIYVQPFPGPGPKLQISPDGGALPLWVRNEIFYWNGDKLMAATVRTQPNFTADKPQLLFEGHYERAGTLPGRHYDVSADGQHFIVVKAPEHAAPVQLNVVQNWFEELKRRVPAK